jgi:predicted DNA binding CopG/RHH family protein
MREKKVKKISPEQAIEFLESIRVLSEDRDEPTQLISLRVPANILRAVKIKASSQNKKYQSLIVQYIREGLKSR